MIETVAARILLAFTLIAATMFAADIVNAVKDEFSLSNAVEGTAFLAIICFLLYGNVAYQLTRLAQKRRHGEHRPASHEELNAVYEGCAPPVAFLVPSYKEELRTIKQTLLSAALQDYPNRRVVLLIDNPPHPTAQEDIAALAATRQLVVAMNAELLATAMPFNAAREAFLLRRTSQTKLVPLDEAGSLTELYLQAAAWFERQAAVEPQNDHTDALFTETILLAPMRALKERAEFWLQVTREPSNVLSSLASPAALAREYTRLATLFDVSMTSFERKRYANLSHEPNKAMNLNTYIGFIGGNFREVACQDGLHLQRTTAQDAEMIVPPADFIITLDADSLLLPQYALRLIHLMTRSGNERVAVTQTPYSAIPNPQGMLERIAGATTDIQYLIHQGFTEYAATYWVGANAVLRHTALKDIAVLDIERGYAIARYIQDRTVIEDTESTVDLLSKGWTLHNYPERLSYSATPPDFGALAVQRGRWANGGLIIFPKLLRYLISKPRGLQKLREGFFRIHYLTSIAGVNVGLVLIMAYPFPESFQSLWLPATALPYYLLYGRDLWLCGYRKWMDVVRVYALNVLLLPVNLGGVMHSLHQAMKGYKIPFRRTPKVAGRTRLSAPYVLVEFIIMMACLAIGSIYAIQGKWAQAVFDLINAGVFIYGIHTFMGWRASLSDLHTGWSEHVKPLLPIKGTIFKRFR